MSQDAEGRHESEAHDESKAGKESEARDERKAGKEIVELMREPEHGLGWLKHALQAAIELEHATIAPYLCAMWSIEDSQHPVSRTLRGIVLDEMRHMGLACNLLTTIGGRPKIHHKGFVPRFPGPLPGGVRPELEVTLAGLSRAQLEHVFLEIELPEEQIAQLRSYPTVGEFYDAIQRAFDELDPSRITGHLQIDDRFLYAIRSHADARKAITQIKREGEGTSDSPYANPDRPGKLAHYYAFKEIFVGRKLQQSPSGKWEFTGEPIPFPDTYPMATVPARGYPQLPESAQFNKVYVDMLGALQEAWDSEGGSLQPAKDLMHLLREPALVLIKKPRSPQPGNYGPSFSWIGPRDQAV